jgi:hypothetical protein
VWVVADNCSDDTARFARAAGANVLIRQDDAHRGKGYALEHAFTHALEDGWADAVVVVDADTVVNAGMLAAFAAKLENGALAAQADAAVLNPDDSWRTRLMALGLALFNGVRSSGRERLGVSCGLRGNGMCLSSTVLRLHPYAAFSLVEDLEYGIALGRAGVRVHFTPGAKVASAMVSSERAASAQRVRWEQGRAALGRAWRWRLLREAISRRDPLRLDLAADLWVPPLSRLGLSVAAGLLASALFGAISGHLGPLLSWGLCAGMLAVYVARGLERSGVGLAVLKDVPRFVAWKLSLGRRPPPEEWVRTEREPEVGRPSSLS